MDDKTILKTAREELKDCIDAESAERMRMMDDLRFRTLDQWPAEVRAERENDIENGPRPCLTIDKINQYRTQIVNDMRQGKPGIVVRPQDDAADVETAKIMKGMVRNIEDQSKADIAYMTAGGSSVDIGLGYFRIVADYESEDSFDQELRIQSIPNTFSVHLGHHFMPDGSDSKCGFIAESMPVKKFKKEYPGKKYKGEEFSDLDESIRGDWCTTETVTVIEYYRLERIDQTLYFLADGTTITKKDYDAWPDEAGVKPTVQDERVGFREQLKWAKMTGVEVLEKRDLPGKYIPIVEVVGNESWVDGKRVLWGIVRPSKDSLRMYNYFASTVTEKMGLAPKTPTIGAVGQFKTDGERWKKSNRVNYAYLQYDAIEVNGNAVAAPARQGPTPIEAALLQQMQVIEHDVQTSLGMFKAAVGETESQQSGRAILALQKESDTGTYHYSANLGISIRHAGRILVDLIPHYYDTKRVVRIMGDDGTLTSAQIDPSQDVAHRQIQTAKGIQSIYNPGVGKYDVSITVGPSYNTKRMEAAATLTEVVKSQPALMPLIGDLLFRSLDFPYSDQIAERMKKMLPPQLQEANQPIPPQAMQKMNEMGQHIQLMQEEGAKLQQENVQLKAGVQEGIAKVAAKREADAAEFQMKQEQASASASFEVWQAKLKAATAIEVAEIGAKSALAQTALQAESDANVELSTAIKGGPGEVGADGAPMKPVRPLDRLAGLHQQSMDQSMQGMQAIAQALNQIGAMIGQQLQLQAQTLEALLAPKQVSIAGVRKDANGQIIGANIAATPVAQPTIQ